MSSSSHKRQKLSQKQARESFDAQMGSLQSVASAGIAKTNSTPASHARSSSTPGIQSFRHASSVAIGANVPYETPLASRQPQQQQSSNVGRSEPSTFLDSAAASSLSTLASDRTQPPRRVEMVAFPPLASNDSGHRPSGNEVDEEAQTHNPTTRGVSSLSFQLWHRKNSFGEMEFGTQSSPPKPLSTLQLSAQSPGVEQPEDAPNTEYTVPTAVAPSASTQEPTTAPTTNDPSPTPIQAPTATKPSPTYAHLTGRVKNVKEGAYLLPLRRQPPFACANPGNSAMLHPPLIVVSPTATTTRSKLTLASNNCSQLMRKAKNYTSGVTRSSNGKSKQQRYQPQSKKRKSISEQSAVSSTLSDATPIPSPSSPTGTHAIHVVTSFALRTLLLEDVWFLKPNTPVVLFFDETILPPRYGKRWLKVWRDTLQSEFIPTVLCQGKPYKQLVGWVHQNPHRDKVEGEHPMKQLAETLVERTQIGIEMKFPIFSAIDCNLAFPPQQCIQQLLSWFEVFHYPEGLFMQADYHPERSWLEVFKRLKTSGDDRLTLFHRAIQESHGDRFMMAEMKSVWERLENKQCAEEKAAESKEALAVAVKDAQRQPLIPPPIVDVPVVKKFCKRVDSRIQERLEDCFGRFNNIFEKFLSESETRHLAAEFERVLPRQFNALMGFSGYDKKLELAPKKQRGFLRLRYSLDVFFQFVARARKHNNHMFVPFAMIFALAQYACGHSMLATQLPVWFGISVSKRTMERRVEEWIMTYDAKVKRSIRKVSNLLCVFDNLQDGRRLQFQSGQSCIFTRVTARFVMAMYIAKFPEWVYSYLERPKLTFLRQAIPAPYQMPAFEKSKSFSFISDIVSVFRGTYDTDLEKNGNPFDLSGQRVSVFVNMVACCNTLHNLKRFLSVKRRKGLDVDYTLQPKAFSNCRSRRRINAAFNGLRKNKDSNIFEIARQFQSRVVRTWRYVPPVAELLILPVSVLDETTKVGATGIIMDFMVLHGLLRYDEHTESFCPGDSWESKWLFIVGDGLSVERMFQFFDNILSIVDSKTASFRQAYRQAMAISRVIHRVVPINGDLHVRFHMLEAIYRLFYGGFLQCVQHRLKWKRLDPYEVSKSYRLCHRLVVLVYEELERMMLDVFILETVKEEQADRFVHRQEEEDLAVFIANKYMSFLNEQAKESKDWLRRFLCNFLLIVKKYLAFLQAEQSGDAVSMEALVIDYLPIFFVTKKSNSFSIQLRLIELYYHGLPISILQLIRMNRTKRQKTSNNPNPAYQKESALDQIMERLMPFFKGMSHNGTEAAFVRVSQMLTACQRAKHFVEFYTRTRSDGEAELAERKKEMKEMQNDDATNDTGNDTRNDASQDNATANTKSTEDKLADPGDRHKKTTHPKSKVNRILVTEVLVLARCHETRKEATLVIDGNHFWRALDGTSLEVKKKIRNRGDGKVETDITHQYVVVQAQQMMKSFKSQKDTMENEQTEKEHTEGDNSDNESMETNANSAIDLEEAIKEQDNEGSADGLAYFSDDESAVVEVEGDTSFFGTQTSDLLVSDDEDDNDGMDGDEEEARLPEKDMEGTEIAETQLQDMIADEETELMDGTENEYDATSVGSAEDNDAEDDENRSVDDQRGDEGDGGTEGHKEEEPLIEKGKVTGMKVAPMNAVAAKDVMAHAVQEIEKKNVMALRQWEAARKEREDHFLRLQLFQRLEKMEDDGNALSLTTRNDVGTPLGDKLDRGLDLFELYKKSLH